LIETKSAVFLRYVRPDQTKLGCLADKFTREFPIVLFKLIDSRNNFVIDKLSRRLGDHLVFFAKVFRREDLFGSALFD